MSERDVLPSPAPTSPATGSPRQRTPWLVAVALLGAAALIVALVLRPEDSSPGTPAGLPDTSSGIDVAGPDADADADGFESIVAPPPASQMLPISVSGNSILRGDEPWWFLGYNSYTWSADCGHAGELMTVDQVDEWFDSMRHDGHGAVRLMFFEGWDLARLDAAIAAAERNNIYVTITLDNGNQDCGEEKKSEQWFADAAAREAYAEHMVKLLERYKGNNTIAWFEYFNEPRYYNGELRQFFDDMGALADTIDPDRLFASGTIASYSLDGDGNFLAVHESPGVDIASLHEYDFEKSESQHGPAVLANSAGKPVIVGEFGVIDAGSDETSCLQDIEKRVSRVQEKVAAYLGTPGYIGAFAWAWQPGRVEGACGAPGIEADPAVQEVLRNAMAP